MNDPTFRLPGPGQPQNWEFVDFPENQPSLLDAVVTGLFDALRLADAAIRNLDEGQTASFNRYFQQDDDCTVEDIFYGVLRESSIPSSGEAHNARVWKIYYDDADLPSPQCYKNLDLAYFVESYNFQNPSIVICPAQFVHYPRVLDHIDCSQLEPFASEAAMDNIGATILHKMLHDYGMTGDAAEVFVSDVEFQITVRNSDGTRQKKIQKGYGPYWSIYINQKQHAGTDNVDNYVWFAVESFFRQKCGVEFGQPPQPPPDATLHASRAFLKSRMSRMLGRHIFQDGWNISRRQPPHADFSPPPSPELDPGGLSDSPIPNSDPGSPDTDDGAVYAPAEWPLDNAEVPWSPDGPALPPPALQNAPPPGPPRGDNIYQDPAFLDNIFWAGFPTERPNKELDFAFRSLIEVWELTVAALTALTDEPTSKSVLRYFREEDIPKAKLMFQAIHGLSPFFCPITPLLRRPYTFYYGHTSFYQPYCDKAPDILAVWLHVYNLDADPQIVICPVAFEEIFPPLTHMRCDILGDSIDEVLDGLGMTLLHELTHDLAVSLVVAGLDVDDLVIPDMWVVHDDGYREKAEAYGAYGAMYVNQKLGKALRNADNYVWFAAEAYFGILCDRGFNSFVDPERPPNWQGRRIPRYDQNILLRAPPPALFDNENPFHVPGLPHNIQFADFPPLDPRDPERQAIRDFAVQGVINAFRLADAAARALHREVLPPSFTRYFQPDQFCVVRNVFHTILQLSGTVPRMANSVTERYFTFYNGDNFLNYPLCATLPLLSAYTIHGTDNFGDNAVVFCPRLFLTRLIPLDQLSCDDLKAKGYIDADFIDAGTIILHELTHDTPLTMEAAGVAVVDKTYQDPDITTNGVIGAQFAAYGPFWSQYANDKHHDSIYNADNYASFALEVFMTEKCGFAPNELKDAAREGSLPPIPRPPTYG